MNWVVFSRTLGKENLGMVFRVGWGLVENEAVVVLWPQVRFKDERKVENECEQ